MISLNMLVQLIGDHLEEEKSFENNKKNEVFALKYKKKIK